MDTFFSTNKKNSQLKTLVYEEIFQEGGICHRILQRNLRFAPSGSHKQLLTPLNEYGCWCYFYTVILNISFNLYCKNILKN